MSRTIRILTYSSFIAMLFLGVANAIIGAAARSIGLTAYQIGVMIAVQNLGFALSVSLFGALADVREKPRLLVVGSLVLAAAFLAFYAIPGFGINLLIMFFIGAGMGAYEGVTDALLVDIYPADASRYININHFFVTFGSIAIALYLIFLQLNWRPALIQSGLAVLALAVVFALVRRPARGGVQRSFGERMQVLGSQRLVRILFVIVILEVGIEASVIGILTTFLVELRGFADTTAQWGLIVLLAGMAVGRLLTGLLSDERHIPRYLLGLFAFAVPLFTLMFFVNLGALTWVAVFLAGLALSACLPLVLALASIRYPEMSGTVLGALKVGIPIGGIILPAVMAFLARQASLQAALAIFPIAFVLALGLLLFSRVLGEPYAVVVASAAE